MLQNSVNNIAEVHSVEQQVAQYKMQSGIDLTYLHYCNLLLLAAIEYDSQFYIKKSSKIVINNYMSMMSPGRITYRWDTTTLIQI
jgi:hypothetical protein